MLSTIKTSVYFDTNFGPSVVCAGSMPGVRQKNTLNHILTECELCENENGSEGRKRERGKFSCAIFTISLYHYKSSAVDKVCKRRMTGVIVILLLV